MAAVAGNGPVPPDMHWVVVIILSVFTWGLGALVWAFRQAYFVKKIDPHSKAVLLLWVATVFILIQAVVQVVAQRSSSSSEAMLLVGIIMVLNVAIIVPSYMALFGMRRSLVNYYNSIEPIGLQLGGAMTFFFSVFYFQYHLSRIAAWKKTGVPN